MRVPVAYEASRTPDSHSLDYVKATRRVLARMGVSDALDEEQATLLEHYRRGGIPPETAAAMLVGAPHAHRVIGVAQENPPENPGGSPGFSQVTKDPAKFEHYRKLAREIGPIDSDAQLYKLVRGDLEAQDQEVFMVVGFDIHNELRVYSEVARGQRDRVAVSPIDILRPVIIEGCAAFAVLHNHPTGKALPSPADKQLTAAIDQAAKAAAGVLMLDHLIVGSGGSYYSFRDRALKRG